MPRYTVLMGKRKTTNRNNTKNLMSTVILLVFAYSARGPIQGRKFYQKQLSEKKEKRTRTPGVTSTSSQQ